MHNCLQEPCGVHCRGLSFVPVSGLFVFSYPSIWILATTAFGLSGGISFVCTDQGASQKEGSRQDHGPDPSSIDLYSSSNPPDLSAHLTHITSRFLCLFDCSFSLTPSCVCQGYFL
mmetsp:Transcript_15999/g.28363  ORF Transcript_15999/g.28363 Transcript_15999/m.28363 type:complete len:116 (-) Transcript_15999:470-817(-)